MAITIGATDAAGSDNGNTASVTINARANTTLMVGVLCGDPGGGQPPAAPALEDDVGNTFVPVGPELVNGASTGAGYYEKAQVYACLNATGNAALTLTATSTGRYPSIFVVEYRGDNPLELAGVAYGEDTTIPYASSAVDPEGDGAALFAFIADNRGSGYSYSVNSPFAVTDQIDNLSAYYCGGAAAAIQTTSAPVAAAFTPSFGSAYSGLVWTVALRETTGGGSSVAETSGTAGGSATVVGGSESLSANDGVAETSGTAAGSVTVAGASAAVQATAGTSAPAFTGVPSLGSHTLKWDRIGEGGDPLVTDPITTQPGSTLVVGSFVSGPNDDVPTDLYGNTFALVTPRETYSLWSGYGLSVYAATNISGGAGHTVTVQKDIGPTDEITVFVIEIRNPGALHGDVIEVLSPNDLVSGEVTTSGPALLLGFWGGDHSSGPFTAVPRDGFAIVDSILSEVTNYIQGAVAYKNVDSAGTYSLGWDESPQQGALLGLFAIEGGAGAPAVQGGTQSLTATTGTAAGSATGAGGAAGIMATGGTATGQATVTGGTPVEAHGTVTVAHTAATAVTGHKGARGALVAAHASTTAASGTAARRGTVTVAHTSTTSVHGSATAGGTVTVTHASAVAVTGHAGRAGAVAVGATAGTAATGHKGARGAVAVVQPIALVATGHKAARGLVALPVGPGLTVAGHKAARGAVTVTVTHATPVHGRRQTAGVGVVEVTVGHTATVRGHKGARGAIAAQAATATPLHGYKGARGSVALGAATATSAAGRKAAVGRVLAPVAQAILLHGRKAAAGRVVVAQTHALAVLSGGSLQPGLREGIAISAQITVVEEITVRVDSGTV